MNGLRQFVTRNQMALFVLLAYLLSWVVAVPMEGALIPHGPMIAAFMILALVSGLAGVTGLWRQMTRWRVGWKWYLIAPGIFLVIHLITLGIQLLFGAEVSNRAHLQSLPAYLGVIVPLIFLAGYWEEPGWLGYALKRFNSIFPNSPLAAALATGVIRVFWHLPLLIYGKIPWFDFLFYSLALQLILTWLYNRTGGSVLIAMIGHLFSNLLPATMFPLFGGADRDQYWMVLVLVACVFALVLALLTRGKLGRTSEDRLMQSIPAGSR